MCNNSMSGRLGIMPGWMYPVTGICPPIYLLEPVQKGANFDKK
jgi:hypothetical protein